jgi:hypothetical protein
MKLEKFILTPETISKFIIADFERRTDRGHQRRIEQAIRTGKIYDMIITVIPSKNRYEIIDGQHRFYSCMTLLKENVIKQIELTLRILENKELENGKPRDIYLALDSGKPLSSRDIVKSYESSGKPLFTLSQFCNAYGSKDKISYFDILSGHHYATTNQKYIRKEDIAIGINRVTKDDAQKLRFLLENISACFENKKTAIIFRSMFLRSIIKVFFNHIELIKNEALTQKWLRYISIDALLKALHEVEQTEETYGEMVNRMEKILTNLKIKETNKK